MWQNFNNYSFTQSDKLHRTTIHLAILVTKLGFFFLTSLWRWLDVLFLWADIALIIMIKDKRLATAKDINGRTALYELARKPFAIESKSQLSVSKRCLNSCEFTSKPNFGFFFFFLLLFLFFVFCFGFFGIVLVCWKKGILNCSNKFWP